MRVLVAIFITLNIMLCMSAPSSISEACMNPSAQNCKWYDDCLKPVKDCDFIDKVINNKCEVYVKIEPEMSFLGQQWADYVRVCIPKMLVQTLFIDMNAQYQCRDVQQAFLEKHIPCYLEGPISFCNIPLKDRMNVIYHAADIIFRDDFYTATKAIQSGLKLILDCTFNQVPALQMAFQSKTSIPEIQNLIKTFMVDNQ